MSRARGWVRCGCLGCSFPLLMAIGAIVALLIVF